MTSGESSGEECNPSNEKVVLGGELPVYRLGFGATHVTGPGVWGDPRNHDGAIALLRKAIEIGIDFIDTADAYGPEVSERMIAEALHPYPAGLVIATKGGYTRPKRQWVPDGRPEHLRRACEDSLRRLRVDSIDVYQLHTPDPGVPIEESVSALAQLRERGKIRHIGVSNFSVKQLERARAIAPIVSVQNHYNLTNRTSEPVLEYCEREGLAFIPYFPLGFGNLPQHNRMVREFSAQIGATPSQVALAWLLKRSKVMLPIPGTSSIAHLEENAAAAKVKLSDSDFKRLEASTNG